MNKEITPLRCRFSDKGLAAFRPIKIRGVKSRDRLGNVVKENRRKGLYLVIWDGAKFGDYYHKDFIKII